MNSFVLQETVSHALQQMRDTLIYIFLRWNLRTFERVTNLRKDPSKDAFQVKIFYHNLFF